MSLSVECCAEYLYVCLCINIRRQPLTVQSSSSWFPPNCECPCEKRTVLGVWNIPYASMLFTVRLVFRSYDREVVPVLIGTIEDKSDKNFGKLYLSLGLTFSIYHRETKHRAINRIQLPHFGFLLNPPDHPLRRAD